MEWEDFVAACDDTLADIDDLPERAEDYGDSVRETIKGMKEWAEENEHATPKMIAAQERIQEGVSKWLRR